MVNFTVAYNAPPAAFSVKNRFQLLGERSRRLAQDPVFIEFLLVTKRIYARRKEDIRTRRSTDETPTKAYARWAARKGIETTELLLAEFDAWCEKEGKTPERREHG